MTMLTWDAHVEVRNLEERVLLNPLLDMLRNRGWIRSTTILRTEVPWNGRRVDLATLTRSGTASAFELKLSSFQRVLEQSMYNRLAFDRSWIVVPAMPLGRNLEAAADHGIGVIVFGSEMKVIQPAKFQLRANPMVRVRLVRVLRDAK